MIFSRFAAESERLLCADLQPLGGKEPSKLRYLISINKSLLIPSIHLSEKRIYSSQIGP
jgi:hypothetical protein